MSMKDTENRPEAEKSGEGEKKERNFIEIEIDKDLAAGKYTHVQTRFPPEPNG